MEAVQPLQSLLETLNARVSALESSFGAQQTSKYNTKNEDMAPTAQEILAYDAFIAETMPPFLMAAEKLGPEVQELAKSVEDAFNAHRDFLVMASECRKPSQVTPDLLDDLQVFVKDLNKKRDTYARTDYSNHSKMICEGIQALGWICQASSPKPYVESYIGALDFWGNKIRLEFKTSNPDQIEFVATFRKLFVELMTYIKSFHVAGVTWNAKGKNICEYRNTAKANVSTASQVAKDEKKISVVTYKAPQHGSAAATSAQTKPACEQRNENWHVEYQKDATLTIKDIHMKQQVYIFRCQNTTITMEGKAKSIVVDSCTKTNIIFDNAISSLEIVSCKSIQAQCKGRVPSVAIDKTDGCQLYITYENRDVHLVTSKSSEMNVNLPAASGSDEYVERPIPEQFFHRITDDLSIISQVSDLYS